MKRFTLTFVLLLAASTAFAQDYIPQNGGGRYLDGSSTGSLGALRTNPYDTQSLSNNYGDGSPYKSDGLNNPYSAYGSRCSPYSSRNPYATSPPKIYSGGRYRGELSANPYRRDSTSNRYGRYGSRYSPDSINNPYGAAGNPYSTRPIYIYPGR